MGLLNRIQGMLENTYDLETAYNVYDFLTTDRTLVDALAGPQQGEVLEKLLIVETDEGAEVSLYLDPAVLRLLHRDDPTETLHGGNLDAFWTVLEGVSHFTFFAFSAGYDREIRLVEMELQAEIDKYVGALMLTGRQSNLHTPHALYRWLFHCYGYCSELSESELDRYRRANHFAGRYCATLRERYLGADGAAGLIPELRRFYRLSHHGKIRHIESGISA